MKNKTLWIIIGVIALILIIAYWNKIFGQTEKKKYGGYDYRVGGMPTNDVVSSQKVTPRVPSKNSQLLTNLQNGTKPPTSGQKQKGDAKAKCFQACWARDGKNCEELCGWIPTSS